MADDNLIVFPRGYRDRPPGTLDEIRDAVDRIAMFHVDDALGPIMSSLYELLEIAGFSFEERHEETEKDFAMVMTTLRSLMCKLRHIDHPYQKIADETFESLGGGNLVFRGTNKSPVPEQLSLGENE